MGKVAELFEVILVVLIVTQMIIPWACGRPMWPLFRAKQTNKLIHEIEREKQVEVELALRRELEELRAKHAPVVVNVNAMDAESFDQRADKLATKIAETLASEPKQN